MKFEDRQLPPLNVFDALCPSRQTLGQVTARWAPLVLAALHNADAPVRFAALRRSVDGISDRMLSQTLHNMEAGGLVTREVKSTIPSVVEYSLTPPGQRIAAKIRELIDVIYTELPEILAFRATNPSPEPDSTP